jgi:Zn-dependent peptidase ImmA (M78 family)
MKVNTEILRWALEWNGLSAESLLKISPRGLEWLEGTRQPTIRQLEQLARKTHTPVACFFRDSIPDVSMQIPDFRTIDDRSVAENPSPELFETIDELLIRQGWLRDYFIAEEYEPLDWVGVFSGIDPRPSVQETVAFLRDLLHLGEDWLVENYIRDKEHAWRHLRSCLGNLRIAVFISGYARSYTHRPFDVNEFRGFVLSDDYAPCMFINGVDAITAQLFTMIHELTHLLFADTGVSNPFYDQSEHPDPSSMELYANKVAASFLVPESQLRAVWNADAVQKSKGLASVAGRFRVSSIVVLRRAMDTGLIDRDTFYQLYNSQIATQYEDSGQAQESKNGGNYYSNHSAKLGIVFTEALYSALRAGYVQYGDAYKMTGMRGQTFDNYFTSQGYVL